MAVVLESDRTFLRELLLNDVDPLAALVAQPGAVREPLPDSPRGFIAAQQETYRESGLGVWAAVHREAGVVVGYAGLRPTEEGDEGAELFCLVDPPYRENGLGLEIARAVVSHAFEKLGRKRIVASLDADDEAGRRFAEKLGLELVGEVLDPPRRIYAMSRS